MTIELFTTPVCGACKKAKAYFNEIGQKFVELDVTVEANLAKMIDLSGSMSVPVIKIGNHVVEGFRKETLDKLLKVK